MHKQPYMHGTYTRLQTSVAIRASGAIPSVGKRVGANVGLAVGERVGANVGLSVVGDSVAGMVSSHVIETPAAATTSSDVKRMNMLPEVAVWIGGTAVPLSLPKSVPIVVDPSKTYT